MTVFYRLFQRAGHQPTQLWDSTRQACLVNQQQRGQIYNRKLFWDKNRTAARRARREAVEEWVNVALADLKEERHYFHEYGIEEYSPNSIARLEELATEASSILGVAARRTTL